MGIPETQLESWASQGSTVRARETYESIRAALKPLQAIGSAEVYLHGSYGNDTNILSDGKVDLIVQLNVPAPEPLLFEAFKRQVISALQFHYGLASVLEGNLSLKVKDSRLRLPAEIVPGLKCLDNQGFEGLWFSALNGAQMTDYPKLHLENGTTKNSESGGRYKEAVRIFKRVRAHLSENSYIGAGSVPSYFLEGLLYNVPTELFRGTRQESFVNCINWLSDANFGELKCQNGRQDLFGSPPRSWSAEPALKFIREAARLWERW